MRGSMSRSTTFQLATRILCTEAALSNGSSRHFPKSVFPIAKLNFTWVHFHDLKENPQVVPKKTESAQWNEARSANCWHLTSPLHFCFQLLSSNGALAFGRALLNFKHLSIANVQHFWLVPKLGSLPALSDWRCYLGGARVAKASVFMLGFNDCCVFGSALLICLQGRLSLKSCSLLLSTTLGYKRLLLGYT